MELVAILFFVLLVLGLAFVLVLASLLLRTGRIENSSEGKEGTTSNRQHKRTDFFPTEASAVLVVLCASGGLLLPWVFNVRETLRDTDNFLKFLFFISVIAIGHILIVLSKKLNWRK